MIKGQNAPLIILMNENVDATKVHALLYNVAGELKHWTTEDITIDENEIILPLSEEETLQFTAGRANLEVKLLDSDGYIQFTEVFNLNIEDRQDVHRIGGDD